MTDFIVDSGNGNGLFCFFEDDGETGYFYLYEPEGRGVIDHIQIYRNSEVASVREQDVSVSWTADGKKCAVRVWDGIFGIFDVDKKKKYGSLLIDKMSKPIENPSIIEDFGR